MSVNKGVITLIDLITKRPLKNNIKDYKSEYSKRIVDKNLNFFIYDLRDYHEMQEHTSARYRYHEWAKVYDLMPSNISKNMTNVFSSYKLLINRLINVYHLLFLNQIDQKDLNYVINNIVEYNSNLYELISDVLYQRANFIMHFTWNSFFEKMKYNIDLIAKTHLVLQKYDIKKNSDTEIKEFKTKIEVENIDNKPFVYNIKNHIKDFPIINDILPLINKETPFDDMVLESLEIFKRQGELAVKGVNNILNFYHNFLLKDKNKKQDEDILELTIIENTMKSALKFKGIN